ncbi:3-deoxy-D-manno-octulosonic acid transferase [Candidatus Pelagibacter sp. HIMB1521]|uniref:3-deoxy-D-manno-octulosonic acid transferase n=1 Tax=Candidatus Pelagibacter sp. HIMB1521 TaxID=3413344 RepID=UPI003F87B7E0
MLFLYQIIVLLILILSPFIIVFRLIKKKEDKNRFTEKFSFPSKKRIKGKLIWFHGASVGEIMSVIPLIKHYEKNKSVRQILITSSTLSSSKVIKKFRFKKTTHQFYPVDFYQIINRFLNFWKPDVAIFIDSEIWPCMFQNIYKRKIPLILLNARLTKKTFNNWIKIKSFGKSVFDNLTIAYPQNIETFSYIKKLSNTKINNLGNLKFAEIGDYYSDKFNSNLISEFKKKKIWIASSTHNPEEIFCGKTHLHLKKKYKNLLTIIIPRHIHRVNKISSELNDLGLNITLHSSKNQKLKNVDIYLVDSFGETKKFHEISSSVFLGGSIVNKGGQNPLEAARFGANILHGPNVNNFTDIYKHLKYLNVSRTIYSPKQLASLIKFKKNKNTGVKIKKIGDKILKKTIKELDKYILNEFKKT